MTYNEIYFHCVALKKKKKKGEKVKGGVNTYLHKDTDSLYRNDLVLFFLFF